jgi:uncharacterized pyridoxamine 5'-phosphate oxidase family protein
MHESEGQLMALEELLVASHSRAGEHLRSILQPENRLTAAEVVSELQGVCVLHLATVGESGAPLVAPVDGLFFKGKFWFGSSESSVRFRHIRREPRVSGAYSRGEQLSVLVSGTAIEIDKSAEVSAQFADYNREVYGDGWDSWGLWQASPYAYIEPSRMLAARVGEGASDG